MTDHPYQVMPPLSDEEYAALRADIAKRGVLVPVVKDQHGNIVDGHHRVQIAAELGIDYPVEERHVDPEQARDVAFALNIARRHLTREQKRQLIAREIQLRPHDSDRAIARRIGCDHKTVGSVRRELRGEIPHGDALGPTDRSRVRLVVEIMKQRTVTACLMKRHGEPVLAWVIHKHDDCPDMDHRLMGVAWREYTDWANSAPETHGILWRHIDEDGDPCGDDCDILEQQAHSRRLGIAAESRGSA